MFFISRKPNQAKLRKKAHALTHHEVSVQLLSRFEELVYHPGMSGNKDVHYQDREIEGAVCCTPSEAMLMYHAARLCNPQHALEIGSYVGWSSAHLASGLSRAVLTCVDPFMETGRRGAGAENPADRAHNRFLQNIDRSGLSDKVQLVRDKSPDVIPVLSKTHQWDFVLVDGWHLQGQPVKDVVGVLPFVTPDVVLLLHDLWIPDVRDAFMYLVVQGWSYRIFPTSNYLTILWRGSQKPWLDELFDIAGQDIYVLQAALARRLFFGLVPDSIEAVKRAHIGQGSV